MIYLSLFLSLVILHSPSTLISILIVMLVIDVEHLVGERRTGAKGLRSAAANNVYQIAERSVERSQGQGLDRVRATDLHLPENRPSSHRAVRYL